MIRIGPPRHQLPTSRPRLRRVRPLLALLAAAVLAVAGAQLVTASSATALDNGVARTPPLGWNSYNAFGCGPDINETTIRQEADAMVSSGMKDAGYQYVNIDCFWTKLAPGTGRDADGKLLPDPGRFPSGMKALADYVHDKGLKLGLYEGLGYQGCDLGPGMRGHEASDAQQLAGWGVDYLKVDTCEFNGQDYDNCAQAAAIRDALAATGRSIVLSLSSGVQDWKTCGPQVANSWRVSSDITASWDTIVLKISGGLDFGWNGLEGPGGWNDDDMLEVGNGSLTATESQTHFGIWAMLASTMLAGNDLRTMSESTRQILTNGEVLAISQDSLGRGAVRDNDDTSGDLNVIYRPLANGDTAVALYNLGGSSTVGTVRWSKVGRNAGTYAVRDVENHADLGSYTDSFSANVPSHGIVMIRVGGGGGSSSTTSSTTTPPDPTTSGTTGTTTGGTTTIGSVDGYTQCATEGGTCSFSGSRQVAYGADGTYLRLTASGGFPCTNDAFGSDPRPGVVKACYLAP